MTTKEAIKVAKIMVSPKLRATTRLVEFLRKFPELDLVELFNGLDDSIDDQTHDVVLEMLDMIRKGKRVVY